MPKKLTKIQLEELKALKLEHPKVKKLLKRAIETWKVHPVCYDYFGEFNDEDFTLAEGSSCCLIGGAINGCTAQNVRLYMGLPDLDYYPPAWIVSGLSKEEFKIVWNIFDGNATISYWKTRHPRHKLLIEEVDKIRKICFGN